MMSTKLYFSAADYTVVGISLIIPVLIGIKLRYFGGHENTAGHYLLAGKNASMFPVVMSMSVTVLSAVFMLGIPAEVYRYGAKYIFTTIFRAFGMLLASFIILPVYFRCNVSSIYEYLEMRFGKYTRYTISAVFIIQTVLYMCAVLLGPVLAIRAVTDISTKMAIIICGAVCTFYCVLGGFKAVLWTDVFQAGLMFLCFIIMYIVGINEIGSISELHKRVTASERLQFFDFRFDFETRYTFWNCIFRGLSFGMSAYGTNQLEVQRSLSMSGLRRGQSVLHWSIVPVLILQLGCIFFGLILIAVFYFCDPVSMKEETGISKYDQLVPYFIVTRLHHIPGLTGLCIAGILSGSLSTMSSALNSLATVTVVDFIEPVFTSRLTDARTVFIAKILGIFYGVVCIGLTFIFARLDSIFQVAITVQSLSEGPILAIFLIGLLTRIGTDKSTVFGLLLGVTLVSWIGFGTLFGGYRYPPLSFETSGCSSYQNTTNIFNNSTVFEKSTHSEIFFLYKMPFQWMPTIGCLFTFVFAFLINFLTGCNKDVISPDSKFLSPVARYWMKNSSETNSEYQIANDTGCNTDVISPDSKFSSPIVQYWMRNSSETNFEYQIADDTGMEENIALKNLELLEPK